MARKKWTPQTDITDSLLKFREKRKWQLSYRRYVLEKMPSEAYAPYFGLDIETLRQWFELQFTEQVSWDNFGKAWQFDHIIPATYFDYSIEDDLVLCWNFINVRVENLIAEPPQSKKPDILAAKPYFQNLYDKTGYALCLKMLDKIARIEASSIQPNSPAETFLLANKTMLENISFFSHEEFNRLNKGQTMQEILLEREILKKFGR